MIVVYEEVGRLGEVVVFWIDGGIGIVGLRDVVVDVRDWKGVVSKVFYERDVDVFIVEFVFCRGNILFLMVEYKDLEVSLGDWKSVREEFYCFFLKEVRCCIVFS